jgi:hypothetical protein
VYIKIALTRLGVREGLAWSRRAAAPATTGVAIDVPFRNICLRAGLPLTLASSKGLLSTR